jgi:hypothetical protein
MHKIFSVTIIQSMPEKEGCFLQWRALKYPKVPLIPETK